jgi:hypothetical protein
LRGGIEPLRQIFGQADGNCITHLLPLYTCNSYFDAMAEVCDS